MSSTESLQHDFCRRLDYPWHLGQLFDYLPDTYFYAKNVQGQFVMANQALAMMLGARGPGDMVGKTDHCFSPHDLADEYIAEDHRVMRAAQPVVNQPWLVSDCRGELKWYLSSKIPLFGDGGKIIGIAGAMRDVEKAGIFLKPYREMEEVVAFVFDHYAEKIEIPALARLAHLSQSQFNRRFKQVFQMTPQHFLLRVRIHAACRLLATTRTSASHVALRTGFCDQSYFTKQFQRLTGFTPAAYRRNYQRGRPHSEIAEDVSPSQS